MTTEQWIAVSSVAAVAVAAIAVVVSVLGVRDQLRAFVFLEYTKRFSKIMGRLSFDTRTPTGSLADLQGDERTNALQVFREYFNMCSEEMWLKSSGRIDNKTWNVWHKGMQEAARSPALREAWIELAAEYFYFRDFRRFMESLISQDGKVSENPVRRPDESKATTAATTANPTE